jgi:hypothetical protein
MAAIKDLIGEKFGRLTVIEFAGLNKNKKSLWKCRCDCENKNTIIYMAHSLKIGYAKSCGCLKNPGPKECNERIREKLLKNSVRNSDCLEWQGYIPEKGVHYGMMYYPKTKKYHAVHRLSYVVFKGEIPDGFCVLHSCDNKKCIEPSHLRLGTKKENSKDMVDRKRHPYLIKNRGSAHHKAKLNEEKIKEIIELRKMGLTLVQISEKFGMHYSMIGYICQGKNWKQVK